MKRFFLAIAALLLAACSVPEDGLHTLHVLTTNDVHGSWFDSTYVDGNVRNSLFAVNHYVDSIRREVGEDNLLLIDGGDCLQGDNASYYYNYVAVDEPHLYPRIAEYMGYDAVCVGNHDIETGHDVFDRVGRELSAKGIAFLGGNALDSQSGKPYFMEYKVFRKAGLKVLVLGYTNPNIPAWLDEEVWSGMEFESLLPYVQLSVDKISSRVRPDVVIVVAHSGTGDGDGSQYENQGLDLFRSLRGVDYLICAHDHSPYSAVTDSIIMSDAGSRASYLGHACISVDVKDGKAVAKDSDVTLVKVDRRLADAQMREKFYPEYRKVKGFTLREVGSLGQDLYTRDAYKGMCGYMNLLHTVQLSVPEAELSLAAPLTYNGVIKAGTLKYNDMFTIYPYENQLFVVSLSGEEIKSILEYSYEGWIQNDGGHILRISEGSDARTGQERWSFVNRSYNFDSCAGLNYTVDVTAPFGSRVCISGLADGSEFDMGARYNVAMTSYRASGGGGHLTSGAGLKDDAIAERIVAKYPEIREMVYRFFCEKENVDTDDFSDVNVIGEWSFVPASCSAVIESDFDLLFNL